MIEQYEDTVCGPVEEKRCEKHWICENKDCTIKYWGDNLDACKTFTVTNCEHILVNKTVTKSIPTEIDTTIEFCESVPKTKCVISQVDKTHCTTETVQVCIIYYAKLPIFCNKMFLEYFAAFVLNSGGL